MIRVDSSAQALQKNESDDDIKCLKCKRKCFTRSVFCEQNHHWIHYRCAKLAEDVIERVESDRSYVYHCKVYDSPEKVNKTLLELPNLSPTRIAVSGEDLIDMNTCAENIFT